MLVVLEGLVMSFWLLLICVVGIANGPIGLVVFYENDVKDRVVELGITTPERIRKWVSTCIGFPLLAAIISGTMQLVR